MRRRSWMWAVLAVLALLFVGCGESGNGREAQSEAGSAEAHGESGNAKEAHGDAGSAKEAQADQTVDITITDGAFQPRQLSFPAGTTVKFVFANKSTTMHEALIDDAAGHDEHEKMMKEHPDMHHPPGDEANIVDVEPGKTATLTHTFDKKGTMIIGCHKQPNHYARGERTTITVT